MIDINEIKDRLHYFVADDACIDINDFDKVFDEFRERGEFEPRVKQVEEVIDAENLFDVCLHSAIEFLKEKEKEGWEAIEDESDEDETRLVLIKDGFENEGEIILRIEWQFLSRMREVKRDNDKIREKEKRIKELEEELRILKSR